MDDKQLSLFARYAQPTPKHKYTAPRRTYTGPLSSFDARKTAGRVLQLMETKRTKEARDLLEVSDLPDGLYDWTLQKMAYMEYVRAYYKKWLEEQNDKRRVPRDVHHTSECID